MNYLKYISFFLILVIPNYCLSFTEAKWGQKANPKDGFTVGGNCIFEGSISVGNPLSGTGTSNEKPITEVTDSNGDIVGSITIGADNVTDGEQQTYYKMYTSVGGVLHEQMKGSIISLTNGQEYTITDAGKAGFFKVMTSDGSEYAYGNFGTDAAITLDINSTNVTTTNDTSANLNIYDSGTAVVLENQLGSTLNFSILIQTVPAP